MCSTLSRLPFCAIQTHSLLPVNFLSFIQIACNTAGNQSSHLNFWRHAGLVKRSGKGDKKHRESFLALANMQSHLLEVSRHELSRHGKPQRAVATWPRGTAPTSKLSSNLTHSISAQLLLVCCWHELFPLTSSWFSLTLLAISDHEYKAVFTQFESVPLTTGHNR